MRVFESLGVPLIGAVDELLAWQGPAADPSPEEAAKRFAALLSAAISTGTQLSARLAPGTQEEAEAARLRVSTLAGAAIAQHYVLSGAMPDDAFNRRLAQAFDGCLALADSFPPLPDETGSTTDMVARRVEALTPFIQAVMRFPFGQEDSLVIRKLGEALCERAVHLADAFSSGQHDPAGDSTLYAERELAFLAGGSKLLARACEVEMDRMQHAMANGQAQASPDPEELRERIWQRFEDGMDVLRAVIGFLSPNDSTGGARAPQPQNAKAPTAKAPAKAPGTKSAPAQASGKQADEKQTGGIPGNPMSFFVKKETSSDTGEAA